MTSKVGYSSPPEHSRWPKGKSGNPRGRPKGTGDFKDDLLAELSETMQITEGGKTRRITKQRALIKALTANGIKGNSSSASLLLAMCARYIQADDGVNEEMTKTERKIVEDYLERQVAQRLKQEKESGE